MADTINREKGAAPEPHSASGGEAMAQVSEFWRQYGTATSLGAAFLVLAIVAVFGYRHHLKQSVARAAQMLTVAKSPQQMEEIVRQYPSTPTAPLAMLGLASVYFDAGDYGRATVVYEQFLGNYEGHSKRSTAEMGKISCLEAQGRLAEALDAYTQFTATHPGDFLVPQAVLGKGRCLLALGRHQEAKATCEDFAATHPDSPWAAQLESTMSIADRIRRAEETAPSAGVSAPATLVPPMLTATTNVPEVRSQDLE